MVAGKSFQHQLTPSGEAVAGGLTGVAVRFLVAPLDIIKIRFQLQREPVSNLRLLNPAGVALSATHAQGRHKGLLQTARTLFAEEGLVTFWRGNLPAVGLYGAYAAVQFVAFKGALDWLRESDWHLGDSTELFLAGAASGVFATVSGYPLDVMRTRYAAQGVPRTYKSLSHLVTTIARQEGLGGFFKGLVPTCLQIAPYMGVNFALYAALKDSTELAYRRALSGSDSSSDVQPSLAAQQGISMASGMIAGFVGKGLVYPLDTVKRRLQVQGMQRHESYGQLPTYRGTWHCVRTTVAEEGAVGLYKGAVPSLIKSAMVTCATFLIYENCIRLIESRSWFLKKPKP
eukprot:TRINITY_DN112282_c0_g1_i1.p1 TRINITY_DN112282_c0_g1~~TRINITY_DN112282_c0_g1_i1.p1  ORF type:complete len:344 (+),score=21.52 TRINITY_DN112282_c0_g1_i1:80-1111(+)